MLSEFGLSALGKLAAVLLLSLLPGLATSAMTQSVLKASLSGPNAESGGLTGFDLWIQTATNSATGAPPGTTSPLWSGGVTIAYDPAVLTFERFDFAFTGSANSNYAPVLNSGLCTSALAGCVSGIEFLPGNSSSAYGTEVPGGIYFGTFLFHYLGGSSPLELGEDSSAPFYFYLDGETPAYEVKEFMNTAIVPLPVAAWLMLGGMGMLGALGFRKSS